MLFIYFLIFEHSQGSKIAEYLPSYNYGQVFHDFSENALPSVNGISSLDVVNDILYTDRGSFFNGNSDQMLLPPNNNASLNFVIPPTFSVILWLMSFPSDGLIFQRYGSSSNYFYFNRKQSAKSLQVCVKTSTINTGVLSTASNTLPKDTWILVTVQVSGTSLKAFIDTSQEITYTMAGNYVETGTYSTYIGSSMTGMNAFKGFVWYFSIADDTTSYLSCISTSSSTNCLTSAGSCTTCNPAVVDPILGTGCISTQNNELKNALGNICPDVNYGCSGSTSLVCQNTICISLSCKFSGVINQCYCGNGSVESGATCICTGGYYDGENCIACGIECNSCLDSLICLTCISSNATPNSVSGCNCNSGYYGTNPLSLVNSCTACYVECATCIQDFLCSTCVATNAIPGVSLGCICIDGYYGTAPLTTSNSCTACYNECMTCTQASLCTLCVSANAIPDISLGCICIDGYYGTAPLSFTNSCAACYLECASCAQALICLICITTHASPGISQGCNCDPGYFGTSPLNSLSSCVACDQECSTCNESLKCFSCIANNASPDITQGCNCNPGYFGISPINTQSSCMACDQECSTCNESLKCLTCIAYNASPDITQGCNCYPGYYGTSPIHTRSSCIACDQECSTCNQSLKCLTCRASNSSPDIIQGCKCDPGFYGTSPLNFTNSCTTCNTECATCDQDLVCLTCIANNSTPNTDSGCRCSDGHYQGNSTDKICEKCDEECGSCKGPLICETCIADHAVPNSVQGCECEEMYYGSKPLLTKESCILCSSLNSNCEFCDSNDSNICLQCLDKYEINEGLCEECDSAEFFNENTKKCESCSDLCLSCTSASDCQICSTNSHLSASGLCECDHFYNGTVDCISTNFTASITIDNLNVVTIYFSEKLSEDLQPDSINLTINGKEKPYTLNKIDNSAYTLTASSINYTESNALKIEFIKQLFSTEGLYLVTTELNIKLFQLYQAYSTEELKLIKYYSSIGTAVGVSFAIGASFTNLDLSSFFNFINCAEIYSYAAIYNLDMDENLKQFLLGLRIVPNIPTFFDFAIDKSKGVQMNQEYNDFGFATSLFIVNQGVFLSIILVNLILTPFILSLNKVRHLRLKACIKKLIESHKYKFYCRLWIQSCLEGTMAAALTIKYCKFENLLQSLDYIICWCFMIIQVIFICSLFFAVKYRLRATDMLKIEKLFKKYSTYFREFKSDAAECCCYYLFFIFRRIGIIVLAFLVPYKELQLSISVTMTLAVIDMQIIIYLIETKAYSNKMICFNIIVNEILTLVYYILLFLPLLSGLGYDKADMAAHTILLVLCALLINVAINLSSILKNIKECIVARISRRSIIHINVLPIDDSQQELH